MNILRPGLARRVSRAGPGRLAAALGAAVTASLTLGACAAIPLLNRVLVPDGGYALTEGIAYGPAARQRLDVYVPRPLAEGGSGDGGAEDGGTQDPGAEQARQAGGPTRGSAKVVVFFYGGGWTSGSKDYYRFVGEAFASRGYVTVIPDYRVHPQVGFPTFVEDAAQAVGWAAANIARFGGDPDALFLAGHSAGAHIAALLATDAHYLAAAGVAETAIDGFIGLAGPYAFDPFKYDSTRPVFASLSSPEPMQPVTFVDAGVPPMLLLHGSDDTTVYPVNSIKMAEAVAAAGGTVERVEIADTGHIGLLLSLASPLRSGDRILERIDRFIARH